MNLIVSCHCNLLIICNPQGIRAPMTQITPAAMGNVSVGYGRNNILCLLYMIMFVLVSSNLLIVILMCVQNQYI